MHKDMFTGMYTSPGTGDILVRICRSWDKFVVDERSSRRIFKQVKYSLSSIEVSHELNACVNVLMHIDMFSGMYTGIGTCDILERICGSWEKIVVDQRSSRRIFKHVKHPLSSIELSHLLHACVNVLMHIDIFSGMHARLGTGDIIVRMCGSWEKTVVEQRSSRRIFKEVKHSLSSIEVSHELHACVNVLMHLDMFSGMFTRIGKGDILVRMCGRWEKIVVDQRSSRRIFKQVKHPVSSIEVSKKLHACVNVLMHLDMFSGMYTSLGTGDKIVRVCGNWEKIVVDQHSSRRIFKQVKHSLSSIELAHELRACVNVLMQIDMFTGMHTSLERGDIPVRMCGSWEKIMVDQRRSRRIFKQVK